MVKFKRNLVVLILKFYASKSKLTNPCLKSDRTQKMIKLHPSASHQPNMYITVVKTIVENAFGRNHIKRFSEKFPKITKRMFSQNFQKYLAHNFED